MDLKFPKQFNKEKPKAEIPAEVKQAAQAAFEKEPIKEMEHEKLKQDVLQEIEGQSVKKSVPAPVKKPKGIEPTLAKTKEVIEIEHILEKDLKNVYFKLKEADKVTFKQKGEETAIKIEQILQKTKVKTKEIFKLIMEWLKVIPGINRLFIKQEAKIKTAEIMKLKK